MLRFHGSFRQEIGTIMVGLGAAAVILGTAELLADMFNQWLSVGHAWLLIAVGPLIALIGLWLNITRSRRRVDIEIPPRETADQSPQRTG
ncbi:MAG: hypothetical protein ACODAQ_10420 [Phycisphaeraceae bacterium]